MSFASINFIFTFLPIAVLCGALASHFQPRIFLTPVIIAVSAVFYATASLPHLFLLLFLIILTWITAKLFEASTSALIRKSAIGIGISVNLASLLTWKYSSSLIDTWNALGLWQAQDFGLIMPLGISFYSLQQIGFLLDLKKGKTQSSPLHHYAAFVLFFPQLIAGPIVRHKRMAGEFERVFNGIAPEERAAMASLGLAWFTIGLFKKVVIADSLARLSAPLVVDAAISGVSFVEAWQIGLASAPRIYFDFSGYSDMAVGIALLFGIRLPPNFNAPWRSGSNRLGWSRWHITFHQFLRDHLFQPLMRRFGKTRFGPISVLIFVVMLSALWHGNSLAFLAWGALVSVTLLFDPIVNKLPKPWNQRATMISRLAQASMLALIFVTLDFELALGITKQMFTPTMTGLANTEVIAGWLTLLGLIAFNLTLSQEISTQNLLSDDPNRTERTFFGWRPPLWNVNLGWFIVLGTLFTISVYFVQFSPPFVYFGF